MVMHLRGSERLDKKWYREIKMAAVNGDAESLKAIDGFIYGEECYDIGFSIC